MKKYVARIVSPLDMRNIVEWLHLNRKKNKYDPEILSYDSTRIVAVDVDGEPQCYLPYQLVIMVESLAPKPGSGKPQIAKCLKEAIHAVVRIAKQSHIGEVYFLCAPEDKETASFAKLHGYEEMPYRVLRLKPKNMVPPLPEDVKEKHTA